MKRNTIVFSGAALCAAAQLLIATATAVAGAGQADHLTCFKSKEVDVTTDDAVDETVSLTMPFVAQQNCAVKGKVKYTCVRSIKNDGDDPRGGDPGTDYACFKIKCASSGIFGIATDSQFSPLLLEMDRKKASLVCVPIEPDF